MRLCGRTILDPSRRTWRPTRPSDRVLRTLNVHTAHCREVALRDGNRICKRGVIGTVAVADGETQLAQVTVPGSTGDATTVPPMLRALRECPRTDAILASGNRVMWSRHNMHAMAAAHSVFLGPIAMNPAVVRWLCAARGQANPTARAAMHHRFARTEVSGRTSTGRWVYQAGAVRGRRWQSTVKFDAEGGFAGGGNVQVAF